MIIFKNAGRYEGVKVSADSMIKNVKKSIGAVFSNSRIVAKDTFKDMELPREWRVRGDH